MFPNMVTMDNYPRHPPSYIKDSSMKTHIFQCTETEKFIGAWSTMPYTAETSNQYHHRDDFLSNETSVTSVGSSRKEKKI